MLTIWTWATGKLLLWVRRWRGRRELANLDDRLLHDIGRTYDEVRAAIEKPFWRG